MPNSTVIAVASAKGGVGKTTTSINLGTAIAAHGLDVVVVELDLAMANVVDFLSLDFVDESDPSMHDVLAGEIPVTDALYEAPGGTSVVPSGTSLDALGSIDMSNLSPALEALRDRFDVVVLDTGAGVNSATTTSVQAADETVLVSTPRVASIRDTEKTRTIVEDRGGDVGGLVLTQAGTGSSPGSERLTEFLGVDLLCTVPQDPTIHDCQDAGVPVVERRPESEAARAYADGAAALVEAEFGVALPVHSSLRGQSSGGEDPPADAPSKEALEAQGWTFPGAGEDERADRDDDGAASLSVADGRTPVGGLQPLTTDGGDVALPDEAYGSASPRDVNVPTPSEEFLAEVRTAEENDDAAPTDGPAPEGTDPVDDSDQVDAEGVLDDDLIDDDLLDAGGAPDAGDASTTDDVLGVEDVLDAGDTADDVVLDTGPLPDANGEREVELEPDAGDASADDDLLAAGDERGGGDEPAATDPSDDGADDESPDSLADRVSSLFSRTE